MKPDKFKKKAFKKSYKGDLDTLKTKVQHPKFIKDEEQLDELPSKTSSNHRGRYNSYSHAFIRFLNSNIGNKWDDVYSQIRNIYGVESVDNIRYIVSLNTVKNDKGELMELSSYGGYARVVGFYVYDGVLQYQKPLPYKHTPEIKITKNGEYIVFKHDGNFFKVSLSDCCYSPPMFAYVNKGTGMHNYLYFVLQTGKKREQLYCDRSYIRSLNKKELKSFNLPNVDINHNKQTIKIINL